MTLQGFSSKNLQGLYRNLQAFGINDVTPPDFLPYGICVYDDKVYVTDHATDSVIVFDTVGTVLDTFGGTGIGDGQFTQPMDIVTDGSYLYLYDNTRIIKHQFDGTFVDSISNPSTLMQGLYYTGSGIAASYYSSGGVQANLKTYDSSFSVIRTCSIASGYRFFHLAGKTGLYTNSLHYIFSGTLSGAITGVITSHPDYIGSCFMGRGWHLGDNGDEIFYKKLSGTLYEMYKYNTTTSSPFASTLVGDIDDLSFMRKVFYYEDEIYCAIFDDTFGDSKISVIDPTDASVIREWTS